MSPWIEGAVFVWHASSAVGWGWLLLGRGRFSKGLQRYFEFRPRPLPALGLIDPSLALWSLMAVTVLVFFMASSFAPVVSTPDGNQQTLANRLVISWGLVLGQSALVGAWMVYGKKRGGSRLLNEWFALGRGGRMLVSGTIATWLVLPLVLRLHKAITELTAIEYRHPTLETIAEQASWWLTGLDSFRAAVVTPFVEEILYRGFFLGALFHLATRGSWGSRRVSSRGAAPSSPREQSPLDQLGQIAPELLLGQGKDSEAAERWRPKLDDQPSSATSNVSGDSDVGTVARLPFWPVVVTAVLFGANHMGQGAAPISLTVLALLLGELVRRTGSLWPAILVHAGLNGYSVAIRLLSS